MEPELRCGLEFSTRLANAAETYRRTWQKVDDELYELCRQRPSHDSFADVYAKVVIIGRVYQAGIARSSRAKVKDREAAVTNGLIEQSDLISLALGELAARPFDAPAAAQIAILHGRITRGLEAHTGERQLTSFVSKYLHFHCDIVPIYDGRAASAIGILVDRRAVATVRPLLKNKAAIPSYRRYVAAFVVLHQQAVASTSPSPTVREIDYLLWQPTYATIGATGGIGAS